jgi:uncharacterized protein (TIGR02246 family)
MMERIKNIDVGLVYKLWDEYAAAWNTGDFERWLSLWTDDGVQILPDVPLRVGKAEIREEMQPRLEFIKKSKLIVHIEEVRILGDQAYSYGVYEFNLASKEGGETKNYSGKFLNILEKQVDGSWKIAIDCHNFNVPNE